GKERRAFSGHRGIGRALFFSSDGTMLASGANDTSVLVWDIADRMTPKKVALSAKELDVCWLDLKRDDALRAEQAVLTLAALPDQSLPLFRERIKVTPPADADRVDHLVADLDSNQFAVRERAASELARLGEAAIPGLRKVLTGKPSL